MTLRSLSFEAFHAANFTKTALLAHQLTGSATNSEDVAQEAFTRIRSHYDHVDNPTAYLRTAVVNACRTWHRTSSREQSRIERVGVRQSSDDHGAHEPLDIVDRPPYRQKAVLVLRYWLDLSEADIADALSYRRGTVKSLAARALTNLRKELPQ